MSEPVPAESAKSPILREFPPLLRNRNFLLLWIGFVVSALGDRIHFVVMLQIISNLMAIYRGEPGYKAGTPETSQLTIMMIAPFILLGPLTGILADRLPRRMIMITSDLARVVIVIVARTLFLRETSVLSIPLLYGLLLASEFIIAMFSAAFTPARLALLPQLVHPDHLLRANSMTNAAGTIASLLGFVIAGKLVRWDLTAAMYVDAGTFLGSAVCLILMRLAHGGAQAAAPHRVGALRELRDGLGYVRHHKHVLQIILLLLVFWSCGGIILNGLTGILTRYYGLSLDAYTNFMGVVGGGMIVGAASVSLARKGIPKEIGIAWPMVGVGVFLLCFSQAGHWGTALAYLVLTAMAGAVLLVSLETLLQRIVPNHTRGRVMAVKDIITSVGLVAVAVPLAIDPNIDAVIRLVVRLLALFVIVVGGGLVALYYRHQTLPWPVAILRRFLTGYFTLVQRFERTNACRIPATGGAIVVANHTSALDPLILTISCPRRIIHFMMAREYYERKPFYYFYKLFDVIPVNRSGTDIASVRTALRALQEGKVIGMFPEGKISLTGEPQEARNGVAALALMSGMPVVPAGITGTRRYRSMLGDFFRPGRIRVRYGAPLRFGQVEGKERDKEALDRVTGRIMEAIVALRLKDRAADVPPPGGTAAPKHENLCAPETEHKATDV